ncbi:MAG TPA: Uma2 family endonuclease [Thermoanaerobaculia bacterium]|nr:Uma2 family endonuclease [Thermoanaerobaculia bacterium]
MTVEYLEEPPLMTPPTGLGPYRVRDYDGLPDEPRCELLYGRLYLMSSPTPLHQVVALQIWRHLDDIAQAAGGNAFGAPLDVELADHSVVQPDVIYLSPGRRELARHRIVGAPDLLVEVLSPGSMGRDWRVKLMLYAESGIREYWIVDPKTRLVEFLVNEGGRFMIAMPAGAKYRSQGLPEVHLDVAELWRQVDSRLPGTA